MKKTLFSMSAIALAFAACNTTPQFSINGTITGAESGNVLLVKSNGNNKLDTLAKVAIAAGKFELTGNVAALTDALLTVEGKRMMLPVMLENAAYTANINMQTGEGTKIEGTATQDLYNQFTDIMMEARKAQSDLYKEYGEARKANDEAKMKEIEEKFDKVVSDAEAKQNALIAANADTYVAALITAQNMGGMEETQLNEAYNKLGANAKASEPGKKIAKRIETLAAVAIGKVAPDFTLNTPEGKPLSMHSIKGKVKVIDFWASWCGPCRGENPNVVAMYKELHPKGLEILSVSLDNKKEAWLKAIEDDKLTWNHVSDLQGWNCAAAKLYGVNGIPHLVVLDENNVIVAKDLRGAALKEKVAELLKAKK